MARSFNGSSDLVTVSDVAALRPGTGSFALSMWVYPTTVDGNNHIFWSKGQAANPALNVSINTSNSFRFVAEASSPAMDLTSITRVEANKWFHIGCVRKAGSYARLFINGVMERESVSHTEDNIDNTQNIFFGRGTTTLFYAGYIGEVGYWVGSHLADDEMVALAHGTLPLSLRHDSLVGYWFPQWAASSELDWTKNGNNGTATGTAVVDGPPVNRLPPITYSFASQMPTCVITTPDVCQADTPFNSFLSLPRSQDESDFTRLWDMTMQRIEDIINNRLLSDEACQACPTACGVVTLDLARCSNWEIDTDVPITQINMPNARPGQEVNVGICNRGSNPVTIGGWPTAVASSSIAGSLDPGECTSPTFQVGNDGSGRGGGFRLKGKPEPAKAAWGGPLVVACEGSCEIDCQAASPKVLLQAFGGVPPYTWETTAGTITASGVNDADAELTPPDNTGTAVAGTAYVKAVKHYNASVVGCIDDGSGPYARQTFGCDDVMDADWTASTTVGCTDGEPASVPDYQHNFVDSTGECAVGHAAQHGSVHGCDTRTAQMVTDGCAPCGATMADAVVTLTDDFGASVTKTITLKR